MRRDLFEQRFRAAQFFWLKCRLNENVVHERFPKISASHRRLYCDFRRLSPIFLRLAMPGSSQHTGRAPNFPPTAHVRRISVLSHRIQRRPAGSDYPGKSRTNLNAIASSPEAGERCGKAKDPILQNRAFRLRLLLAEANTHSSNSPPPDEKPFYPRAAVSAVNFDIDQA